ncbi:MAG: transglycosylase domain-containing protein, partial [Rickettsiales bacterium]|nr:transglycosylase domain-containing protein [Rickettsiales bacterium]
MAKRIKFRYRLAKGAKAYRCGPGIRRVRPEYRAPAAFSSFSPLWRAVWHCALIAFIWGAAIGACWLIYLAFDLPDIDAVLARKRQPSIAILDRSGLKISTVNDLYGTPASIETLPPHVWQAVVAVEDKRFFKHFG